MEHFNRFHSKFDTFLWYFLWHKKKPERKEMSSIVVPEPKTKDPANVAATQKRVTKRAYFIQAAPRMVC